MTESVANPEFILFNEIEHRARDYALNGVVHPFTWHQQVEGLLSKSAIDRELKILKGLDVDRYISRVLEPAESASRASAKATVQQLPGKVFHEVDMGPLYAVELDLQFKGEVRRVGIIAQNRSVKNGVWGPEHHLAACRLAEDFGKRSIPIATFMDTPGADAGAEANKNNQAHSISRLIATMANVKSPTIGIIYGLGYSGGAIPLATTNLLLAVRHGAFNTIQPKGLANIARQYKLSWQESARYVGVSPHELCKRGIIDGIIDWDPSDGDDGWDNLAAAIVSGIEQVEAAAQQEVVKNPSVTQDYLHQVKRYTSPDKKLQDWQKDAGFDLHGEPSEYPSVFGHAILYLRSLSMRSRIRSSTTNAYGRLAEGEIPKGDLDQRTHQIRQGAFQRWLSDPEKLVYNDKLAKLWANFKQRHGELNVTRGRISSLILGDPQRTFRAAERDLCFSLCLDLYNRWKSDSSYNFVEMDRLLAERDDDASDTSVLEISDQEITVLDVLHAPLLRDRLRHEFRNVLVFDQIYDTIVNNFGTIAEESKAFQTLSESTLRSLLDSSIEQASKNISPLLQANPGESTTPAAAATVAFARWLRHFSRYNRRGEFLKNVEEWKRVIFTRLSDSLLVLITYFFENLVPEYMDAQLKGKPYTGRINPGRIGKRKDFWNQLNVAYQDLLIQRVLDDIKRRKLTTTQAFLDRFVTEFDEIDGDKMTANPVNFPGFRQSIEKALAKGITPCGIVTGIGRFNLGEGKDAPRVGIALSNMEFQAGAFDMAGAEKFCTLLQRCALRRLPVVCFVSSGGMQTKEGPSSLFSMAIINDRISRFIAETGLPVVVFGFGDCTGGSQASFVTHPLVHTYYLSGADMPFAGRVVVPSFLPSQTTVANYLVNTPGAMQGLVKHPFAEDLDRRLQEVDPAVKVPSETIEQVVAKVLAGTASLEHHVPERKVVRAVDMMRPLNKVLIHARGCTAVKLIRIAQKLDINVLLVQSDPDMESVAVDMLREQDEVVCLGGQTPDESYLNAQSVVTIANSRGADSLHPGIGFLSENSDFARVCRGNGLNFVGPRADSMDTMGNKSNAIHTAMSNQVPVVPGSHGILTSVQATAAVADEIGYPVILKAVHGGGGKGIKVVRSSAEIRDAFNSVYSEARSAFGSGDLYLEKFVESMRHIEVQILRDSHGNTRIIGLRDCTVQRNNQKVLEESGSTMLPESLEQEAYAAARRLADAVDYYGAGTVEFIFDLKANAVYFMEMNTRLQVEHPVTEWTSGISIVSEQFNIAAGKSIAHLEPIKKGFSIEARVTAEKARRNDKGEIDFLPTPGLVTECSFPERDDMELIASVAEGKTISPFYDSMIAQLIVYGEDRNDAIAKLRDILDSTSIKGVCTNIPLLKRILADETFINGDYDTRYLPRFLARIDQDQLIEEMAYTGIEQAGDDLESLRIAGTDEIKVVSPLTGVFYTTPSPNEPDYVAEGSAINLSQTLCQIEAMKLFTPISLASVPGAGVIFESDKTFEVVRINQPNGSQVNAGDLLFVVKPV